jgi:hypothetical protein
MLKRSIIASGIFHAAIITATSLVLTPSLLAFPDETPPFVPVEVITIAEKTNIAPTIQKDRLPPEASPLAQVASLDPQFAPPPPEPVELAPEPETPEPPPPPPEQKKEVPPPAPPPVEEAKQAPPAPLPKLVMPKRKPPPPEKRPDFNVDSVLALLDKRTPPKPVAPPTAKLADTTVKGIGEQSALTVDLKDALLNQMRACWNVPVGAPNPEQLIVQVRVFLAQDGSLARPPQLEPGTRAAASGNAYIRTAAEAALRAINICEPYRSLPADKYQTWREIVMTFDPSKMTR